jgi:hypothetical protein
MRPAHWPLVARGSCRQIESVFERDQSHVSVVNAKASVMGGHCDHIHYALIAYFLNCVRRK